MITRKEGKSVTKRTNAPFGHSSCVMTLLSPVLSKQTFIAQHLKLQVIISFVLCCEIFLIFEISLFICQEQRVSRKWLSNQNCSIDLCLLSCLHLGRMLTKVNCLDSFCGALLQMPCVLGGSSCKLGESPLGSSWKLSLPPIRFECYPLDSRGIPLSSSENMRHNMKNCWCQEK